MTKCPACGDNSSGTGIGLAIVRKIVRLYGGHIWVEETQGGGTTFFIEWPLWPAADSPKENCIGSSAE